MTRSRSKAVILQLDEHYRITADELNFILQRKQVSTKSGSGKRKSNPWRPIGFFMDLRQVLAAYSQEKIKETTSDTLDELFRTLTSLNSLVERIGERCVSLWGKSAGERNGEKDD